MPQRKFYGEKVGQGIALRSSSRELVCRLRCYFEREKINGGPLISVNKVVERTAEALIISQTSVKRIWQEKERLKEEGGPSHLTTPGKTRKRPCPVTAKDDFQVDAIRRHVYEYYARKERPTVNKLIISLREQDLFKGSDCSLRIVLKRLGFEWKVINGKKLLLERSDIAAWRSRFFRTIRSKPIEDMVWLGETWVDAGQPAQTGSVDDSVKGTVATPSGKRSRLIVCHAGSYQGFIPNCLNLYKSKITGDYIDEMDSAKFIDWFKGSLLANLKKPSIIVMDNAAYRSLQLNKPPNASSRKGVMMEWLESNNVQYSPDMKRNELLELVNQNKPMIPTYEIDEVARKYGHEVIRLPPYHSYFNAIELIWAQVKGYVTSKSATYTISEVEQLTREAINEITDEKWNKVVLHARKEIEEAWNHEGLIEDGLEDIIFSLGSSSSSDEEAEII